jgi:hypothetical protein
LKNHGFNNYEVVNDVAVLKIFCKNQILNTTIDIEDLQKLIDLNIRWYGSYKKKAHGGYYAQGNMKINGRKRVVYLATFLLDLIDKNTYHIDHKNSDTLDNRKSNLRKATIGENIRNRKGKNSNNTSGYRNVCFYKGRYIVQIQVSGKNTRLGTFDNPEDAGNFAEEMRKKYYGDYAGKA